MVKYTTAILMLWAKLKE